MTFLCANQNEILLFFVVFLELQEDLSQLETTNFSPEKFRLCIPQSTSKEEKETKVLSDFRSVLDCYLFIPSLCLISYKFVCWQHYMNMWKKLFVIVMHSDVTDLLLNEINSIRQILENSGNAVICM